MEDVAGDEMTGMNVWKQFNDCLTAIRDELSKLSTDPDLPNPDMVTNNASAPDAIAILDQIKVKSTDLQNYITSSVSVMPAYDVRRTQEMIDKLNVDIKAKELLLKPKKKFAFSSRTKPAEKKKEDPAIIAAPIVDANHTEKANMKPEASLNSKILQHIVDETLLLSRSDFPINTNVPAGYSQHQLLITDCSNSTITAMTVIGSVRIERSTACLILLGPCYTSVYLDSCKDCSIFVSCHQLRIHECDGCRLYVRVNSHPIIEDCKDMGFAPYHLHYHNIMDDFQTAALTEANDWSNVVDFRWHKKSASPNWHIISEAERISTISDTIVASGWTIVSSSDKHVDDKVAAMSIVADDEI